MACRNRHQSVRVRATLVPLLVALACGCSGSTDEPTPQGGGPPAEADVPSAPAPKVLARVQVPEEWPGDWTTRGESVRHISLESRVGLLFDRGDGEGSVGVPVPSDASDASTVRLELMSDGPFVLEVSCGGRAGTINGRNTRRIVSSFEVELGPAEGEAPQVLTVRRQSSDHPVLLERVVFVE